MQDKIDNMRQDAALMELRARNLKSAEPNGTTYIQLSVDDMLALLNQLTLTEGKLDKIAEIL